MGEEVKRKIEDQTRRGTLRLDEFTRFCMRLFPKIAFRVSIQIGLRLFAAPLLGLICYDVFTELVQNSSYQTVMPSSIMVLSLSISRESIEVMVFQWLATRLVSKFSDILIYTIEHCVQHLPPRTRFASMASAIIRVGHSSMI